MYLHHLHRLLMAWMGVVAATVLREFDDLKEQKYSFLLVQI
jgi:hypothetical protein